MPIDVSPGSFAATAITALFWWTVLSPLALLAVAVLCATRPRLRAGLTIVVLVPPLLVVLPVAVMHGGVPAAVAAISCALEAAALVLAVTALVRGGRRPDLPPRHAGVAVALGVAGGMVGSGALVGVLLFT